MTDTAAFHTGGAVTDQTGRTATVVDERPGRDWVTVEYEEVVTRRTLWRKDLITPAGNQQLS